MKHTLPTVEGLNQKDALRLAGMHVDSFRKLLIGEHPRPKNSHGYYEFETLGQWIRDKAYRDKVLPVLTADLDQAKLDPAQERARKDRALAIRTETENKVRSGQLIELDTVTAAAFDVVFRVKARLLRIPAVTANLLTGITDRVDIQEIIEREIRNALEEMSTDWADTKVDK
ncbi:hypothetical protein [Ruegeria sp. 6PALISEP08]|uniref:hypothetical protein n=1 Tax=Ruegeria sp. 6PALISEP08 TaxID=1225660 RepID=UPI000AA827A0|nr:hypothetical protein [Ruegeria sp. 6PALISEP08]